MRKNLPALLFFFAVVVLSKAQSNNKGFEVSANYLSQAQIIDSLDTVVVDMSQASYFLNSIRIPVSVLSDDAIYALDINFKYNQLNLQYDSIINLTNYIQAFSFYNTVDSTVRFTSNSMNVYTNDSPLVSISCSMLNANINVSDFYSVNGYLNGDPCIVKLIGPLGMSINESTIGNNEVNVYPSPAKEILHINSTENSRIRIMNLNGIDVIPPFNSTKSETSINLESFPNGIYIVKFSSRSSSSTRRVLIEK